MASRSPKALTWRWGVAVACLATLAASDLLAQTPPYNVQLLSNFLRHSGRDIHAAVWGYTAPDGTELAILGMADGTSFVDVTDPQQPVEVAFITAPTSIWREMQTWSHYAYIVTEGGGGMQIVDLADPHAPYLASTFDSVFLKAHTLHIRDGYAYANGTPVGWVILDLADPVHPRQVGSWSERYVHDCFVRGNRGYLCNITMGGFTIMDLTDKRHPIEMAFIQYAGAATHNAWTTTDGHYLFTTDETNGGHLHVWDVADPNDVMPIAEWSVPGDAIIHNVVVRGDSAYIAYYTEGLQVLDISEPTWPRLVASYDTHPGVSGGTKGAWGVYPFRPNGDVYVSDMNNGLYVLRLRSSDEPLIDFHLTAPEAQLASPGAAQCQFYFDLYNDGASGQTFDLQATDSASWPVSVASSITVPSRGVEGVLVTVQVPLGLEGPQRLNVDLCARSQATDLGVCSRTHLAVPVTLQEFSAERAADGVELRWRLAGLRERNSGAEALVISRVGRGRPGAGPGSDDAFVEEARVSQDAGGWRDREVDAEGSYTYRLALVGTDGMKVLGETSIGPRIASPVASRLLGNWPNPFNPTTAIRFELAKPGDVSVVVYDPRGRLVRRLSRRGAPSGSSELLWNGADERGRPLSSGVYLYELRSSGWEARGRMDLIR